MIVKRGNKYGVRVWDKNAQEMRWIGTYTTKAEAKDAEARATLKPTRGRPVTITEWADMWLSDYARPAAATRSNHRYATTRITGKIGALNLHDIDRPLARRLAGEWPRTTTRVARTMFGDAMRDGLIDFNPFSDLRLETPRGRKDIDALTETQIRDLARIAEQHYGPDYGPESAAIILTLGFVGVRPGELCSLRRKDLEPGRGRLTIRYSTGADGVEKQPKNGKERYVHVPSVVFDALDRVPHRVGRDARVFLTYRERPFSKGNLAYWWRPIGAAWAAAGNKPVTLYHLRHACATLLVERGLSPADVAAQLGHQDGGRLVMTLYGHPEVDNALDRIAMSFATNPADPVADAAPRREGWSA